MKQKQAPAIKLIALDLDGTLLNPAGEITEENRKAIKEAKENGVEIILSTGRSKMTAFEIASSLGLLTYLINVNGGEIWGANDELIERQVVDHKHIQWMWNLSRTYKTRFWATSCNKVYHNDLPADIENHEWLKFGFDIDDHHIRETVLQELLATKQLEVSNSSLTNIEVNRLGVNKARGIEKVSRRLGISMKNAMAVGDSLNDIAMIKECGWGVAMGNAQDIVKEMADAVTATNEENGVAAAIYKWVLP